MQAVREVLPLGETRLIFVVVLILSPGGGAVLRELLRESARDFRIQEALQVDVGKWFGVLVGRRE